MCRSYLQRVEEIGRNLATDHAFGLAASSQVIALTAIDGDLFEDSVLLAPVDEVGICDRHSFELWTALGERDQSFRLFVGEGSQKDRVDNTKDRGVCPDAQR